MSKENSLKEQGNTYFKKKDYEKAIHYYREGLEINPQNWILNNNIAQAYLANKKYLEAQTHAVISVALQENSVKGYYRAAKAAYLRNRIKSALDYVRMGLSVCPQSEELRALMDQLKNQNKPPKDLTNGYPEKTEEKSSHKPKRLLTTDDASNWSGGLSRALSSSSHIGSSCLEPAQLLVVATTTAVKDIKRASAQLPAAANHSQLRHLAEGRSIHV